MSKVTLYDITDCERKVNAIICIGAYNLSYAYKY